MQRNDEIVTISMEEKNLTQNLQEFKSKNDFKKYASVSVILLLCCELILGFCFNTFFSEIMEQKRKLGYTNAWNNYISQRLKFDFGQITGNIWWTSVWKNLKVGNTKQLEIAFNTDSSIRENYDLFTIYLKPDSEPVYSIQGAHNTESIIPNPKLIQKLYNQQSYKLGRTQTIAELTDNRLFLISVSALCDDAGNPIYPGIAIFAYDLNKFLRLAEEVIPVSMEVKSGNPPTDTYHSFTIPNDLELKEKYYIDIKPEYEIQTIIFKALALFITAQTLLSLSLFILIAPHYTKKKTAKLEEIIKATEQLNIELTQKIKELKIAHIDSKKSEAKYEHLVESSKDIIFSFDKNGFILTANNALVEFLGFKKEDLMGKFFLDMAYNPEKKIESLEKKLMMEKFEELKENHTSVSFDMTFGTKNNEPLQLGVKWEYVKLADDFVVFGKAYTVSEDSMLRYFEAENRRYVFNNYITLAEQISQRITSNLIKYMDIQEVFNVRICVREIIINSIEHGNLDIDYEMKTKLRTIRGEYFRFLQERQNDPRYKNRKVTVHYSLKSDRVSFLIKDEGKGFDHKKMLRDNADNANIHFLDHGRGIFMTKNTFDKIKYNNPGNKVLLIKFFKK
ncbi:MAG: ATP-binding protein [Leptospiraceae bacterium]|nr:ATP-binding protein [Leptospiraceae bacterium]